MQLPPKWKRERANSLRALGMRDYVDYLASPLWAVIRRRVYRRSSGTCEMCKQRPPTAIHHWGYSLATMQGHTLKSLTAVCDPCHRRCHGMRKPNGKAAARSQRRQVWRDWIAAGGALGHPCDTTSKLVKDGHH